MIKIRWKTDLKALQKKERSVERNAAASAREAAELFRREIRDHWTSPGPSTEGQPPAIWTGNLDESIFIEKQGRDPLGRFAGKDAAIYHVRIQTSRGPNPLGRGEYAGVLDAEEGMNRPFVEAAADRTMQAIPHIFGQVFGRQYGGADD